ncbi:hypothetical protein HK096_000113, partial [Nowakowskiella sp. JEL0078]
SQKTDLNCNEVSPVATDVAFGIWGSADILFGGFEKPMSKSFDSVVSWDYLSGKPNVLSKITVNHAVTSLKVSNQGSYLSFGSTGNMAVQGMGTGVVSIYDASALRTSLSKHLAAHTIYTPQNDHNDVSMSLCETRVVCCGADNTACVYDVRYLKRRFRSGKTQEIAHLAHGHDSALGEVDKIGINAGMWTKAGLVITGGEDGLVKVWDVNRENGVVVAEYGIPEGKLSRISAISLSF